MNDRKSKAFGVIILYQIASAPEFKNFIYLFSPWISILQIKLSFMTYLDLHENELIWKPVLQMNQLCVSGFCV